MFGFGITEWLLVAFIGLLLFGPKVFVKTASSLGQGVKEFKQAVQEGEKATGSEEGREAG